MAAAADDGGTMLALADQGENERQRSTATGERFTDTYSQLEAFRYSIYGEDVFAYYQNKWSAVFFDRYAFFICPGSRLNLIEAYDLDTSVVRFVNLNP